jgi:hypothetical protein
MSFSFVEISSTEAAEHCYSGFDDDFERLGLRGIAEGVIGVEDLVELETMRDQAFGIDLVGRDSLEQHRDRGRVDQPGGDGDILVPKLFQMQVDLLSVHTDIGNMPAGSDDLLAKFKSDRDANRLDRRINAALAGHRHDRFCRLAITAVDGRGSAEPLGDLQAIVIQINHDDLGRRIELRGQQRGKTYRPGPNDGDGAARLDLAVQHTALKAGREDIAEHDQRFFVRALGNGVKAHVGVRDADKLRLGSVDGITQESSRQLCNASTSACGNRRTFRRR